VREEKNLCWAKREEGKEKKMEKVKWADRARVGSVWENGKEKKRWAGWAWFEEEKKMRQG
jgi:hypothetical protein